MCKTSTKPTKNYNRMCEQNNRRSNRKKRKKISVPGKSVMGGADLSLSRGSAYDHYKQTTIKVRDSLSTLVPFQLLSVSDLAKAVNYISGAQDDTKIAAVVNDKPDFFEELINDLNVTISLREKVGATYAHDYNDGHHYIIEVLKHCREALRTVYSCSATNNQDQKKRVSSQFQVLLHSFDDDEDEATVEDEQQEDASIRRRDLKMAETKKEYSIEDDLIKGSLVFQASMFFLTAENLFSIVVDAYETLHKQLTSNDKPSNTESITYVMQAAAVVNNVLKNVSYFEKTFLLESPQFHSIYHIFAVLIFQNEISEMEAILSPDYLAEDPSYCSKFVSQCIRFGFLGAEFYFSEIFDKIFNEYFALDLKGKRKLNPELLKHLKDLSQKICATTEFACLHQSTVDNTVQSYPSHIAFFKADGTQKEIELFPVQWLKNYEFLGGKVGLLCTFSKIESFWTRDQPETTNNQVNAEMSMQQMLDSLWIQKLFPTLSIMDRDGDLKRLRSSMRMPMYEKTMPFLRIFEDTCPETTEENFVDCRGFSFASVFSIHSLVYGSFILQNESKRIAVLSKLTLAKFQNQLADLFRSLSAHTIKVSSKISSRNIIMINETLTVALHQISKYCETSSEEIQASLNPLLSGSFLNAVSYSSSLERGFINWEGRYATRAILHLYNGLRKRKLMDAVDLLDVLDRIFSPLEQETWQTDGKPEIGNLMRSFFMAVSGEHGSVIDQYINFLKETKKHKLVNLRNAKQLPTEKQIALMRAKYLFRLGSKHRKVRCKLDLSGPAQASSSHALLFSKDNKENQSNRCDFLSSLFDLGESCSRETKLLTQKMKDDSELLSLNWFVVGHHIDVFWLRLLEDLDINELVEEYNNMSGGRRQQKVGNNFYDPCLVNVFLANAVFRELDFVDDDSQLIKSKQVAKLMTEYFTNVATLKTSTFF
mmetsp:Transcript_18106/g.27415  ORF Transcript_18106/g.27415 Transcript_18106/m.27415 type:complete len:936 (+) Transcript_18106:57-2864(+)